MGIYTVLVQSIVIFPVCLEFTSFFFGVLNLFKGVERFLLKLVSTLKILAIFYFLYFLSGCF